MTVEANAARNRMMWFNAAISALLLALFSGAAQATEFIKEDVRLPIAENSYFELKIKRLKTSSAKSLPAVLLFGGFETSDRSIDLVHPQKPVLLVTFAYPFKGPKKIELLRDSSLVGDAKRAIHQTLFGIEKLIGWVKAHGEVNPDQIYLVGVSLGAPFAAMAVQDDIKGLVLVHGFIHVRKTMAYSLGRRWSKKWGVVGEWAASLVSYAITWYVSLPSAEEKLKNLKQYQRVLVYTSRDDDLLPAQAAQDIRSALIESRARWEERVMEGEHIRAYKEEVIRKLVQETLDWTEQESPHYNKSTK